MLSYTIQAKKLAALANCTATKDAREALNGVHFIEAGTDSWRATATNGHQLLRLRSDDCQAEGATGTTDAKNGHVIAFPRELVSYCSKQKHAEQLVHIEIGGSTCTAEVPDVSPVYACELIDAPYADACRVIESATGVPEKRETDETVFALQPQYFELLAKVSKLLQGKNVSPAITVRGPKDPVVVRFPDSEGSLMVLMPVRL